MIKFTELRVHKGHLIITAEVRQTKNYYDNVYIEQIKIDTQDTFSSSGHSSSLIYESEVFENRPRKVTLDLTPADFTDKDLDMDKTMFFVYAKGAGLPSADIPCGFDDEYSVGVTFSLCPIYNDTMRYVKQVEETCELPKDLINLILQFKAIEYSINSGHFTQAIKYYNKFYKSLGRSVFDSCGCHG